MENNGILLEYMYELIQQEKSLEVHRQVLCKIEHFCPYSLFKLLDSKKIKLLSKSCFYEILKFKNDTRSFDLFFNYYDRDRDGYLNYKEFLTIFIPQTQSIFRSIITQTEIKILPIPKKVILAFSKIIEKELTFFEANKIKISKIIKNITETNINICYDLFNKIDVIHNNTINKESVFNFLTKNSRFKIDLSDVDLILFRLGKQTHLNNITYEDFKYYFFELYSIIGTKDDFINSNNNMNYLQSLSTINHLVKELNFIGKDNINTNTYEESASLSKKVVDDCYNISTEKFNIQKINDNPKLASHILTQFFEELMKLEKESEIAKQNLALRSDIQLTNLFNYFHYNNCDLYSGIDFEDFYLTITKRLFIDNEDLLTCHTDNLKKLFYRYDCDNDGRLEFLDFCEMIIPKKYSYSKIMRERSSTGENNLDFSFESKLLMSKLFRILINNESSIESITNQSEFKIVSAFDIIEIVNFSNKISNNIQYFTIDELGIFCISNGLYFNDFEISLIFSKLDRNRDDKVTILDLSKFFNCSI